MLMKRERDERERGRTMEGGETERERDEFKVTITRKIMMRIINEKKMKNQCINLRVRTHTHR